MSARLLDLFCGAGGASMGYYLAGFDITGVDNDPGRAARYPFRMVVGDALAYLAEHGHEYDVIHASPPCHDHSDLAHVVGRDGTAWMLTATLDALAAVGKPWVVENVPRAALPGAVTLCGSMFNLGAQCTDGWRQLRRHRLFASSVPLRAPGPCSHQGPAVGVYGKGGSWTTRFHGAYLGTADERKQALGIGWMGRNQLSQAIPPAYTRWIGQQLRTAVAACS